MGFGALPLSQRWCGHDRGAVSCGDFVVLLFYKKVLKAQFWTANNGGAEGGDSESVLCGR
jgi:hypothetical protein